jgi:diacylglycerol kinase family enzyme
MHGFSLVESPLVGARLFFRSLDKDRHVSIYRGKQVIIERKNEDFMHIDGDPVMMPAKLVIENISKGINILVPPTLPDDV